MISLKEITLQKSLASLVDVVSSHPIWIAVFLLLIVLMKSPLPGRGPRFFARKDVWRGFKFETRRLVLRNCQGRCEAPLFFIWGRCKNPATEVDHIYPWSRRGPTIISNGQGLCTKHNRRKGNKLPPWWCVLALEKRRLEYFPKGVSVRVHAKMRDEEKAERINWAKRQ